MIKPAIAIIAASALLLTACGADEQEVQAICMDPNTNTRIDDDFCEDDEEHFNGSPWVFFMPGVFIPPVGSPFAANSYHRTVPSGYRVNFNDFPHVGGNFNGRNSGSSDSPKSKPSTKISPPKFPSAPKSSSGSSGSSSRSSGGSSSRSGGRR